MTLCRERSLDTCSACSTTSRLVPDLTMAQESSGTPLRTTVLGSSATSSSAASLIVIAPL